uniref:Uncharacterized protein n=1 Tax=Rousettus aegyptiacus TaxID=9407 RepID=A0A7J8HN83_ROUAE|nr:hypothetical protein HJG63_001867 [Rousettus aegyptiacus]
MTTALPSTKPISGQDQNSRTSLSALSTLCRSSLLKPAPPTSRTTASHPGVAIVAALK